MDGAPPVPADQLNVRFSGRWELLKDVIVWLYLEQEDKLKLKDIVEIMKQQYQFDASETQYKSKFGVWKVKRAIPVAEKENIKKALETRAQQKKSSVVLHRGKVEHQQIRRYMKEQAWRDISIWTSVSSGTDDIENLSGHALQCGNRVFMNWSMPAAVLRYLKSKAIDHTSPFTSARTPMSDILIATPPSDGGPSPRTPPSPGSVISPNNEKSAMNLAVKESLKVSRAHLLVQKDHKSLLRGMNLQEQCITTDWLNQFWQFSFKTAKAWGRGPQVWNASNLRFSEFSFARTGSHTSTPFMNAGSPEPNFHYRSPQERSSDSYIIPEPSPFCRWSIHIEDPEYELVEEPEPADETIDPDAESSWKPWTSGATILDFAERLQENLKSNDFSTVESRSLPISTGQIAKAAKRSPQQMMEEAFGFSIMARNIYLINDMLRRIHRDEHTSFHELYPLHLAANYLDGSKTCCDVFVDIVDRMVSGDTSVRKLYVNHLNHTVLDNLMLAILKGHTSCTPAMVDEAFKKEHRFAGEEVDICGRWDADSDCIRYLHASGKPEIPQHWKHMFCHTSVQAINHCIKALFARGIPPGLNMPSGLFLKRCPNETCGLKLQLKPLHTLVITAVYLAQFGKDGENLFGMLACLLCLLGQGANPLLKADVSLDALLNTDDTQHCSHSNLDPLELAQKVPWVLISKWPEECITGWRLFCTVLRLSQTDWSTPRSRPKANSSRTVYDDYQNIYSVLVDAGDDDIVMSEFSPKDMDIQDANRDEDEEEHEVFEEDENDRELPRWCKYHEASSYFSNKSLATLRAAVQAELLTYRRLAEGDPWISTNFDMKAALSSLDTGRELAIGLVSKGMMKPLCDCGMFDETDDHLPYSHLDEACAYYFSNLEDYSRTTFLLMRDNL